MSLWELVKIQTVFSVGASAQARVHHTAHSCFLSSFIGVLIGPS